MGQWRWGWGCAAACVLAFGMTAGAQDAGGSPHPAHYRLVKTLPLTNSGGWWDYLGRNPEDRQIYVSAGNQIIVVNADTYDIEGTIGPLNGTHGVAISHRDEHGFTSNGGSNDTTEFDAKSLQVMRTIPLPIQRPDGLIHDPATDRIFFFNHNGQAAAVDASSGKVVGTVELPSKDAEFAAADGHGHVFDNLEDSSQVVEIDAKTLKIMNVWPLAPCEHPSGMAMDTYHKRLFVGCHNQMLAVMNAETGKVVTTLPIGPGVDAVRFDAKFSRVFASSGGNGGTITVIHEDNPNRYTLLGNLKTQAGARTMELDPETHKVFTVTAQFQPPAPGQRRGRMVPGSFHLLVYWDY
ncbi:MAG: YncE family protein [Terriglobales bacterium]